MLYWRWEGEYTRKLAGFPLSGPIIWLLSCGVSGNVSCRCIGQVPSAIAAIRDRRLVRDIFNPTNRWCVVRLVWLLQPYDLGVSPLTWQSPFLFKRAGPHLLITILLSRSVYL
jgi:hypothetical protein